MATYELTLEDGSIYQVDTEEPTTGNALTGKVSVSDYNAGKRNLLGNIVDRPSAAIRGALQNPRNPIEGYKQGAVNPGSVPGFQEQWLDAYYKKFGVNPLTLPGGNLVSAGGLAADLATNPANLLMMLAGKTPMGGGRNLAGLIGESRPYQALENLFNKPAGELVPKTLMSEKGGALPVQQPTPESLIDKAQKITTEILQPSKTELAKSIQQGKQLPAIEQAAKVITKSKNYTELRTNIDNVIKGSFVKRNRLLAQNNFKVKDEYLTELKDLIANTQQTGQATSAEINTMKGVLAREQQFIKKNPNLNRLQAQLRKEKLQDLTHKLLEKRESGDVIDKEPARNLALDALRKGLKRVVNANDPEIAKINDTYGGLRDAKWLISGQEALAQKAVPQNIMEKVVRFFTKPQDISGDIARSVLDKQFKLPARTKQIAELMKKASALKGTSR